MMNHFLFTTNIPSPYRVIFWNLLGQQADVTVVFERRSASDRDANWQDVDSENFKTIFCKGRTYGAESAVTPQPIKHIRDFVKRARQADEDDKFIIIVGNATSPTGIMEITYMRNHCIPYWVEGDGAFVAETKGVKARIKRFLYSKATGCLSTCINHDAYYGAYGVDNERIYRYQFSSFLSTAIADSVAGLDERILLRNKLAIKEKYVFLYVGQFIHRKGIDVLLDVARRFAVRSIAYGVSVGFYLVGGDSIDEALLGGTSLPENVHICGFNSQSELTEFYRAADVFVLPTREDIWGLVVNEAMAKGLPVVTTDRCNAGVELVHEGENGYIEQAGEVEALDFCLMDMINKDIDSPGYLRSMGEKSLEYIQGYTIENMVERHLEIIEG